MRADDDLMKRLAAADPLRDADELDPGAEREAEALLTRLLATPAVPERRARYPRLRRWSLAAGLACAVAVAFVAFNLVDEDAPGPGAIEHAVAALTREDSVYHILQRRRLTGDFPEGVDPGPFLIESWHSSEGQFHEKIFADRDGQRGRLLEEVAGKRVPGRRFAEVLRYHADENRLHSGGVGGDPGELPVLDPGADPAIALRELESRGALTVAGTTDVGGRRGYRLVSDPIDADDSEYRFEYVVDSVTYLPLSMRWSQTVGSETVGLDTEFLVYERLPLDADSRAQLDLDPHPGATCVVGAGDVRARDLGYANPCPPSGREGPARTP